MRLLIQRSTLRSLAIQNAWSHYSSIRWINGGDCLKGHCLVSEDHCLLIHKSFFFCGCQACVKRIQGDDSGHKHCTGQYFDYWQCIDKCVSTCWIRALLFTIWYWDHNWILESSGCTQALYKTQMKQGEAGVDIVFEFKGCIKRSWCWNIFVNCKPDYAKLLCCSVLFLSLLCFFFPTDIVIVLLLK